MPVQVQALNELLLVFHEVHSSLSDGPVLTLVVAPTTKRLKYKSLGFVKNFQ